MRNQNPGQDLSIDEYRYLQLVTATRMRILLRGRDDCLERWPNVLSANRESSPHYSWKRWKRSPRSGRLKPTRNEFSRPLHGLSSQPNSIPSDESLGYCRTSALRTLHGLSPALRATVEMPTWSQRWIAGLFSSVRFADSWWKLHSWIIRA